MSSFPDYRFAVKRGPVWTYFEDRLDAAYEYHSNLLGSMLLWRWTSPLRPHLWQPIETIH